MADDAAPRLTPAEPLPAHVPTSLVHDFDMLLDPQLATDPHERYRRLLAEAPPIFWSPRNGGHWMLNRHELAFEAGRDWESFSSVLTPEAEARKMLALMPPGARIPRLVPISVDPPVHGAYRMPLNAAFAPKAIAALKGDIRALAASLVDAVAGAGRCEFVSAVAEPLPVQVFLKFMGLPLDHQAEYRAIVRKQLSTPGGEHLATTRLLQEMADLMRETIVARRDDPRDDLISRLWNADIDGRKPTQEDLENYGVLLFIAGLDTVLNAIGFGVHHLAKDPALQARLRSDPSQIPEAVEELLRRYSIVLSNRRLGRDVEFHGVAMKAGDRVLLNWPGADLDPARWPEPERVDVDRQDKAHLMFASGPHRCVGSHLARVELLTLYEELLARLPPFRLDPDRPPQFHGGYVIGVDSLDLVWET